MKGRIPCIKRIHAIRSVRRRQSAAVLIFVRLYPLLKVCGDQVIKTEQTLTKPEDDCTSVPAVTAWVGSRSYACIRHMTIP